VISLLAGKPSAAMFPLTGVELTTPRVDGSSSDSGEEVKLKVDDNLLAMGLQYSPTSGIPPMVEWLTDFQEREHGRRSLEEGWRISITAGSQDAIYKASLFVLLFARLGLACLLSPLSVWLTRVVYLGCTSTREPGRSCLD
jgi:aspartate/methionine/tyrosine aminotransferase